MSLSKLRQIHIIIIGSFLCVAAGVGLFMLMVKPKQEALTAATSRRDTASQVGNAASEAQANQQLTDAIMKVNTVQQSLDIQMRSRMPNLSFAKRDIGMLELWNEYTRTIGPLLNGFAKDKNVEVVSATFTIPSPPINPNDTIFDQDVLIIPLGNVQVSGSFSKLMNNIRRWNNCKRLVMVGPPSLSGTSPNLTATYALTCYIFPVAKGGPQIEMAGKGGASVPTGVSGGIGGQVGVPMPGSSMSGPMLPPTMGPR